MAAVLLVSAGTAAVVAGPAASAATPNLNATYVFVNRNSGKAMDVFNWATNDQAPINQFARNNLAVQQWRFVDVGSGYRVYFTRRRRNVVILLLGGGKGSQARDIARAKLMARAVE